MQTIKELFCEDPTYLFVLCLIAQVGLFWYWKTRQTRRAAWLLLVPVGLAGVAALTDYFIETDREELIRHIHELAATVEQGRYGETIDYFADSYDGFGGEKDKIEKFAETNMKRYGIETVEVSDITVQISRARATMKLTSTLKRKNEERKYGLFWTVQWAKLPDVGWKIVEVSPPRQTLPGF